MIHRFDLTVKKELTKESGPGHPTLAFCIARKGELSDRTNSRMQNMKWG